MTNENIMENISAGSRVRVSEDAPRFGGRIGTFEFSTENHSAVICTEKHVFSPGSDRKTYIAVDPRFIIRCD